MPEESHILTYAASVEVYDAALHFAKIFLINDKFNSNRWGVTRQAILRALPSALGKFLLGPPDAEHGPDPSAAKTDAEYQALLKAAAEFELKHKVGEIVDYKVNGTAYAIAKVDNEAAWAAIQGGKWKFVSPRIMVKSGFDQAGKAKITDFSFQHLAFVKSPLSLGGRPIQGPAYGPQAEVKDVCNGELKACAFSAALDVKEATTAVRTEMEIQKMLEAADFPWSDCMDKMMSRYGDQTTAQKVCAAIKNKTVGAGIDRGLWKSEDEALTVLGARMKDDPLFDLAWSRNLDLMNELKTAAQAAPTLGYCMAQMMAKGMSSTEAMAECQKRSSPSAGVNKTGSPCDGSMTCDHEAKIASLEASVKALTVERDGLATYKQAVETKALEAAVGELIELKGKFGTVDAKAEREKLSKMGAEQLTVLKDSLTFAAAALPKTGAPTTASRPAGGMPKMLGASVPTLTLGALHELASAAVSGGAA